MLNQLSKKAHHINHHKIQTNISLRIQSQTFLKIQCVPAGMFSFYDVPADSKYNSPPFLPATLNKKMLQNHIAMRNHLQISYP